MKQRVLDTSFNQGGIVTLDQEQSDKFFAYFLGVVKCPPAYARQDLGTFFRALFMNDRNEIVQMVIRPRTASLTRLKPLSVVHVETKGKKGSSFDTRIHVSDEKFDVEDFASTCAACGVLWEGSAAMVYGDERAVDHEPGDPALIMSLVSDSLADQAEQGEKIMKDPKAAFDTARGNA